MKSLSIIGKYLDQPRLVKKLSDATPFILVGGGTVFTINEVHKAPDNKKRSTFIKNVSVLTGTIGSALLATRGLKALKINGKTIFKGFQGLTHEHVHTHEHHHEHGHNESPTEMIDEFLQENQVTEKTKQILNKAKTKILNPKEIKIIFKELGQNPKTKEFLSGEDGLIPNPEIIDSKHIFSEIKRLSVMGLVPVLGGIIGGIAGDKITEKDWKERIPNKVKEGSYQYLANIFLCNVGAGIALLAMEKAKITSKAGRAVGMIAGIILTGIVGGSAIANIIGKTFIDPLFKQQHAHHHGHGDLFDERKPELLDVSLHVDDVSTVAVLSGLKWIEPALPVLYSISGYRAGIGYRNEDKYKEFFNNLSKFEHKTDKREAFSAFQ